MTKTQIQLPDPLYHEVKRVANELDWPLAEVLRRGAEYMVRCHPPRAAAPQEWKPPQPEHLGAFKAPFSEWRELANEPNFEPQEGG